MKSARPLVSVVISGKTREALWACKPILAVTAKGLDRVAGEETDDTANHNLFVGPEVVGRYDTMSAMLGVDLPIIERNSTTQLVPTWRIRASLSWAF